MTDILRCAAFASFCLWASVAEAQQFAGWHGNLDRAAELSAKSGKPLFVVFRCER